MFIKMYCALSHICLGTVRKIRQIYKSYYGENYQNEKFRSAKNYEGYYRDLVMTNFTIFVNFLHSNSYNLVVFYGPSLKILSYSLYHEINFIVRLGLFRGFPALRVPTYFYFGVPRSCLCVCLNMHMCL